MLTINTDKTTCQRSLHSSQHEVKEVINSQVLAYYSAERRILETLCGAIWRCSRVGLNSAESEPI